jgi:hypothetical protein
VLADIVKGHAMIPPVSNDVRLACGLIIATELNKQQKYIHKNGSFSVPKLRITFTAVNHTAAELHLKVFAPKHSFSTLNHAPNINIVH